MSVSQEEWMVTQSKTHCLLPPFIGSIFLIIPFKNIVTSFYSAPKYINNFTPPAMGGQVNFSFDSWKGVLGAYPDT